MYPYDTLQSLDQYSDKDEYIAYVDGLACSMNSTNPSLSTCMQWIHCTFEDNLAKLQMIVYAFTRFMEHTRLHQAMYSVCRDMELGLYTKMLTIQYQLSSRRTKDAHYSRPLVAYQLSSRRTKDAHYSRPLVAYHPMKETLDATIHEYQQLYASLETSCIQLMRDQSTPADIEEPDEEPDEQPDEEPDEEPDEIVNNPPEVQYHNEITDEEILAIAPLFD